MSFCVLYYAECETCQDTCDRSGLTTRTAAVIAEHYGWQAVPTQWIHGGEPVYWKFYCPTHRTDLG